jgi:hypothetical protein
LIKADWLGEINLSITVDNLPARTLATNLYRELTKEMGRKSPIPRGTSTLGIRVIKYEEKLRGMFFPLLNFMAALNYSEKKSYLHEFFLHVA